MAHPRAIEPEELLAEAGWVRGIVRRLVLDEGLAEDVVQDTWVAALERSGAPTGRGGLRAWLAAVAGNLARRRRRRERVRAAVEASAARGERIEHGPGQGGASELERMQLQRALVEAILALEEPFRSAVVLRHLDGLPAAEIARRQGCTSELARARVSRGLAQLRSRLAREHGTRGEGLLALVPLLGRGEGLVTGGILLGAKAALGIAGGVALALALWITTRDDARGTSAGGAEAPVVAVEPELAGTGPSLVEPGTSQQPSTTPSSGERREAERSDPAGEPHPLALQGRITDTLGRPLAGARLELLLPAAIALLEGPQPLDFETFQVLRRLGEEPLTSAEDGRVAQALPASLVGRTFTVRASCTGYVPRQLELELVRPFTLELLALPAIEGRLVDPAGGAVAPPGHVKVQVLEAATQRERTESSELAADGTFRAAGLPLGRLVLVEARARGFAASELRLDQPLAADVTTRIDVELARGAVVTGIVLDARTREPVPGAAVWLDGFGPEPDSVNPATTADELGRFRLAGANEVVQVQDGVHLVSFWLLAGAEGYTPTPKHAYVSTVSAEHAYDFELELQPAGAALELCITRADGTPAAKAKVWAIDSQGNPRTWFTDGNGEVRQVGLPAGELGLWIQHRERRELTGTGAIPGGRIEFAREPGEGGVYSRKPIQLGPLHALRAELELSSGATRRAELVLAAPGPASLAGRVVDPAGRGLAGVAVRSHLSFEANGVAMLGDPDELVTDAEGRYRLAEQHAGKYELWVESEDPALACALPRHAYVDVAAEGESVVEDIVVGRCLTLEGRIEPGTRDLAALEVAARDPRTGAQRASTRPDTDGSFRFEPLVEQVYDVVLLQEGLELDRTTAGPSSSRGIFLRSR